MAVDSGTYTPDVVARRKAIADALYRRGSQKPIEHWAQGVAHLGETALAGYADYLNRRDKSEASSEIAKLLMPQGGSSAPMNITPDIPQPTVAEPPQYQPGAPNARVDDAFKALEPQKVYAFNEQSPLDPVVPERYVNAISKIESGGKYDAIGPVTKSGDRAYGKYQVMGNNIGPWTADVYGKPMTPQEFLANPVAQDAVFQRQFGRSLDKYGNPQDAASVWFTGKPLAQGANRADVLGTTGQGYVDKFMAAARDPKADVAMALAGGQAPQGQPQQPPVQVAQAGGDQRAMIAQLLQSKNPYVQQMGQQLAQTMLQEQFTKTSPTFGVIGEDQFGNKQYGWIDPKTRSISPAQGGAPQQAGPVKIAGPDGKMVEVPPGQDPKKFREHLTTATADAAAGKMTEVQANSTQFANRMEDAEKKLNGIEGEGTSLAGKALSEAPWGLATAGNYLKGENRQKFEQARSQFITGLLRRESGAAIAQAEFERYDKEFFPQPGDSEAVIQQKREARKVAIEGMKKSAGPGYKSPEGVPAASAPAGKVRKYNPATGKIE